MFVTEAFQVVFLVPPVFEDFDVQVQEDFFPEEGFDVNTGFRADFFQCGSLIMMPFWESRSTLITAMMLIRLVSSLNSSTTTSTE